MQMSSGSTNSILSLSLSAKLVLNYLLRASYLSESNFTQEVRCQLLFQVFVTQKFRAASGNGAIAIFRSQVVRARAKYFSRASVIRFQLKPLTALQLRRRHGARSF